MMSEAQDGAQLPVLVPVEKPLSLIPVGLKEAALDSPSFRASASHFEDQVDTLEKWLDGLVKSASKLTAEVAVMEGLVNTFLSQSVPPGSLSEATLDHDYTLLIMRRFNEGAREHWSRTIEAWKKTQASVVDPIKAFLAAELRHFKEIRRQLDQRQRDFDNLLSRYLAQGKTKEASALREDAFQLHEGRKLYLRASMEFCIVAPQLRLSLDVLLIKISSDQFADMRNLPSNCFSKNTGEMDRVKKWSQEMSQGEKVLRRELLLAKKQLEESAEIAARPSRELDDYSPSTSTIPNTGNTSLGPARNPAPGMDSANSTKQGWLFLRSVSGKPARTVWVRRWFFVKNGIFGWLVPGPRSGGVEESEKIGVLLCNVRVASQEDRRFCFEVKTKDNAILLQAETQPDLIEWLAVFEKAKQKALDGPSSSDMLASSGNPASDAAFAVNPAVAPELAAKRPDGQLTNISDEISGSFLGTDSDMGMVSRNSFDVTSLQKREGDKEGERSRDHAARIIHKLDLHRKSNAGAQLTGASSSTQAPGGIASLISSSHTILPVGPGRPTPVTDLDLMMGTPSNGPATSLAPPTLANPPIPTNLSRTVIKLGINRGLDLGVVDASGGMPSGLMANQWGSANYGHISRLERGEINRVSQRSASISNNVAESISVTDLPVPIPLNGQNATPISSSPSNHHRKTASVLNALDVQTQGKANTGSIEDFPDFYPSYLRAHDSQFRMLFPNVSHNDRVVLVFRTSWNPDDSQDLPGRIFVTLSGEMYFYSHHFGLVLVSSTSLSKISRISSTSKRDHDFLYLHLQPREGRDQSVVITLKSYLEPFRLLRRRLEYLTKNSQASVPESLEHVIQNLTRMEAQDREQGPDSDSGEAPPARSRAVTHPSGRSTGLHINRKFYAGDSSALVDPTDVTRFKLPSQPVQYTPTNVNDASAERVFEVSAKALFHVIFGDESVVTQMLYRQRRAQVFKQYPWKKTDIGHYKRQFEYQISTNDGLRRRRRVTVLDTQTIDVANDHLCYVVTDSKTPWHLPHARHFHLVTKIVITHFAKSKCKLAIFTKTEWSRVPILSWSIIERHALDDLHLDALDLMDLVTDQVDRLGRNCSTKRAVRIFGHIGHVTEAAQITASDAALPKSVGRGEIIQRNLPNILFETARSVTTSAISTIIISLIGIVKAFLKVLSAQTLLLTLLLFSITLQLVTTSDYALTWRRDRSAANFMTRIGIGPNTIMSKSLYIKDLQDAIPSHVDFTVSTDNKCSKAFKSILDRIDVDTTSAYVPSSYAESSTRDTAWRLHRSRQRIGAYRHDLLVALRLVNSIERETVQAEYENWLYDETRKCNYVNQLLNSNSTGIADKDGGMAGNHSIGKLESGNIAKWYRDYCESCKAERKSVESVLR